MTHFMHFQFDCAAGLNRENYHNDAIVPHAPLTHRITVHKRILDCRDHTMELRQRINVLILKVLPKKVKQKQSPLAM